MEIGNIIPHIEALIFASDKPLTSMEITELINNAFGFMEEKLTLEQIQTSIDGIIEKYNSEFYPFEVRESGGGWQFLTKKDFHKTVAQLNGEKFLKRLSSAALETLAIIAYKQPITKGEIEAIRGVSSDYSIQKLLEKELIVITGRNEEMPGKPLVYSTSKTFMDYFGINSAADLPKLKEIFADTIVEPTIITHSPGEIVPDAAGPDSESGVPLVVTENGELLVVDSQPVETTSEETPGTAAETPATTAAAGSEPDPITEESDEVADTDSSDIEDTLATEDDLDAALDAEASLDAEATLDAGADLSDNTDAESSESDEEGDDDFSGFGPDDDDETHDPASDESDEDEDPESDDPKGDAPRDAD